VCPGGKHVSRSSSEDRQKGCSTEHAGRPVAGKLCPRCGTPAAARERYCPRCGALLSAAEPPGVGSGAARPARDSAARLLAFLAVALIVVAFVILATVPFPKPYSLTIAEQPGNVGWTNVTNQTFPVGSVVSGSWHTWSGGKVEFTIETANGSTVYEELASSGSFSFLAQHSLYEFRTVSSAAQNTSVNGTYSAPLL
jgi:hypothetical protein